MGASGISEKREPLGIRRICVVRTATVSEKCTTGVGFSVRIGTGESSFAHSVYGIVRSHTRYITGELTQVATSAVRSRRSRTKE
jgi:hypothetical protein